MVMSLPKDEVTSTDEVKIDLEEQLRDTATENRLQAKHRQQTVHRRAEDALATMSGDDLDPTGREVITQERQHAEQRQETAHMRAS
jgi:HSP20 family protein